MSWVGVGTAVGVIGAGILSSRASTKAAEIGAEGAERSGAQIQAAGDLARRDVQRIFPQAQGDLVSGAAGAADILGQGISEQQRLFSAGNVGAQQTLGQGFGNIQAALLGQPINQQAFAPQGIPLSQPIANPFGQALGGGQVEGGLFSNLGQSIAENRAGEDKFGRIQNLADRVQEGGQKGVAAQNQLARLGFDGRGRPVTEDVAQQLTEKLTQQGIDRLVERVKTGSPQSKKEALAGLKKRGFNRAGKPL